MITKSAVTMRFHDERFHPCSSLIYLCKCHCSLLRQIQPTMSKTFFTTLMATDHRHTHVQTAKMRPVPAQCDRQIPLEAAKPQSRHSALLPQLALPLKGVAQPLSNITVTLLHVDRSP
jgi:hypothetical protein